MQCRLAVVGNKYMQLTFVGLPIYVNPLTICRSARWQVRYERKKKTTEHCAQNQQAEEKNPVGS